MQMKFTQEEIDTMALEANDGHGRYGVSGDHLRRFAEIVAERTAQKLADVCDDVAEECSNWEEGGESGRTAAMWCASRIRSV